MRLSKAMQGGALNVGHRQFDAGVADVVVLSVEADEPPGERPREGLYVLSARFDVVSQVIGDCAVDWHSFFLFTILAIFMRPARSLSARPSKAGNDAVSGAAFVCE